MLNATPLLRLFARYRSARLAAMDPGATQAQQLLSLVHKAKDTIFGKAHGFGEINSVKEFQKRVPLRTYEQMWTEYWQPQFPRFENLSWPGSIPYFAVSSGTTSGKTKYLPLSNEMIQSNVKGGTDILVHHVRNRPDSQFMGGRSFVLGGSTELVEEAPGIFSGDLSGIAVKTLPWWATQRYFPPKELALLKNWEEKIAILSERSLKENIRMVSGVPSWMLIFFKRLWELRPQSEGTLAGIYPDLEMIVHGGVNFAPYHKQFTEILKGTHAELREVYPASEGFIAVADRGYGDGLRMILDSGIFYEFVPVEELGSSSPTRHWISDVERDVNYAIVLTTCAGLWSYVIGDTVRFVDTKVPRVLVTGRTSYYLSAFGEHLAGEEVEDAVSSSAQSLGLTLTDYSMGAVYPKDAGELGGHLIVVEFDGRSPTQQESEELSLLIEKRLCERNDDYEAHRAKGFGLNAPKIMVGKPGTFAAWMKSRGKLGGQNKVPRIISDKALFDSLTEFTAKFILLLAFILPSIAGAQSPPDSLWSIDQQMRSASSGKSSLRTASGFGAELVVVSSQSEFEKFQVSGNRATLKDVRSVTLGEQAIAFVLFDSPALDSKKLCDVIYTIVMKSPNGKTFAAISNAESDCSGKKHGDFFIGDRYLAIRFVPRDALGKYTIEARMTDKIGKSSLNLSKSLEIWKD